ncbi:uncharacterized protein BDR25DRAFT_390838 [Lindgomyces ingoldianus]|uniref:Uncharacterized protein n=1 Tax=Lindgomyces ingoldianus TaxID=673940 RepID=A0ACB6RG97_9PLEO|nr:uncharacterized protein BDR25DRAFT_390838 [Lindgomyces ingoldianus]KAF2477322.1 hypothetical protein BDR25DRAFT_390838 [Lindgomyces ingoldianus]
MRRRIPVHRLFSIHSFYALNTLYSVTFSLYHRNQPPPQTQLPNSTILMFTPSAPLVALTTFLATSVHAAPAAEPVPAPVSLAGKYQYAAAFATWDGDTCYTGAQHDHAEPDGVCQHLPGKGLTIWWLAPGCIKRRRGVISLSLLFFGTAQSLTTSQSNIGQMKDVRAGKAKFPNLINAGGSEMSIPIRFIYTGLKRKDAIAKFQMSTVQRFAGTRGNTIIEEDRMDCWNWNLVTDYQFEGNLYLDRRCDSPNALLSKTSFCVSLVDELCVSHSPVLPFQNTSNDAKSSNGTNLPTKHLAVTKRLNFCGHYRLSKRMILFLVGPNLASHDEGCGFSRDINAYGCGNPISRLTPERYSLHYNITVPVGSKIIRKIDEHVVDALTMHEPPKTVTESAIVGTIAIDYSEGSDSYTTRPNHVASGHNSGVCFICTNSELPIQTLGLALRLQRLLFVLLPQYSLPISRTPNSRKVADKYCFGCYGWGCHSVAHILDGNWNPCSATDLRLEQISSQRWEPGHLPANNTIASEGYIAAPYQEVEEVFLYVLGGQTYLLWQGSFKKSSIAYHFGWAWMRRCVFRTDVLCRAWLACLMGGTHLLLKPLQFKVMNKLPLTSEEMNSSQGWLLLTDRHFRPILDLVLLSPPESMSQVLVPIGRALAWEAFPFMIMGTPNVSFRPSPWAFLYTRKRITSYDPTPELRITTDDQNIEIAMFVITYKTYQMSAERKVVIVKARNIAKTMADEQQLTGPAVEASALPPHRKILANLMQWHGCRTKIARNE